MAGMPGFIQLQAGAARPRSGCDRARPGSEARRRRPGTACASTTGGTRDGRQLDGRTHGACRRRPCSTRRWRCAGASTRRRQRACRRSPTRCCWCRPRHVHAGRLRAGRRRASSTSTPPTTATAACTRAERAAARRAHLDARLRARQRCPTKKTRSTAYLELLRHGRHRPADCRWPDARRRARGAARRGAAPRACARAGRHAAAAPRRRRKRSAVGCPRRAAGAADAAAPRRRRCASPCVNGDLKFVRQPLLRRPLPLADADRHRARDRPADRRRDERVAEGRALSGRARHAPGLRQHAAPIRTTRWQLPRPAAVIVVGLGEEGQAARRPSSRTPCARACIAWAQRLAESGRRRRPQLRARGDADRQRRHRHHAGRSRRSRSRRACARPTSA